MEKFYSPEEVATMLNVHLKTIYNWIQAKKLVAVKAGHLWRIPQSALEEFLQSGSREAAE